MRSPFLEGSKGVIEVETDVLIVGGGFAGLWAAVAASEERCRVVVVDKSKVTKSGGSSFSSGLLLVCTPEDDKELYFQEIIASGEYLCDQEWCKIYIEESYERAVQIERWGSRYRQTIFERDDTGKLIRRKVWGYTNVQLAIAPAQSYIRVLKKAAVRRGVRIVERVMITDLVMEGERVVGAIGFNYRSSALYLFKAKVVVLAAGAAAFKSTFAGIRNLTGEAVAAGYRAGAMLKGMEFSASITSAADYDVHGTSVLLSIGAEFVNDRGEKFMYEYNPRLGSRAGLAELSIAFCQEIMAGRGPIYLDATGATTEDRALFRRLAPDAFQAYCEIGYSPFDRPVKWSPVPYGYLASGGGLAIDTKCQTKIAGLFAAGDCAWRACHGASGGAGLASGFAIVSGYRAGRHAALYTQNQLAPTASGNSIAGRVKALQERIVAPLLRTKGSSADEITLELQNILFKCPVLFVRSEARLQAALDRVLEIKTHALPHIKAMDPHELVKAHEVESLVINAEALFRAALSRKESRGFHFRQEYPLTDNVNWLKHVLVAQENGRMHLWTEELAMPYVRAPHEYTSPPGIKKHLNGC